MKYLSKLNEDPKLFEEVGYQWDVIMKHYIINFVIPNILLEQPISIKNWKYYI
jgi:hypothetical protein